MLLIDRIGELLTMDTNRGNFIRGKDMANAGILHGAALVIEDGKILEYGTRDTILQKYDGQIRECVDAHDGLVTPGLVDPHTHAMFIGTRENEFEMRIDGKTYMEIAEAGGGILSSMRKVREASEIDLINASMRCVDKFLRNGVTSFEIKSGYGLSFEAEMKMLHAIAQFAAIAPQKIVATFMGAHEIPPEYRPDGKSAYVQHIVDDMIPTVAREKLAQFVDVFCEPGVFDLADTGKILRAAKSNGLQTKLHADEIKSLGGTELGITLRARSVDHLAAISEIGIHLLGESDTVAVLLPGTMMFLSTAKYAPARQIIDSGGIVALGTDFNPGTSPTTNLPLVMSIACTQMRMRPIETFIATTINAAYAIGIENECGSITAGKNADIIIWDADNHRQVPYFYGDNLVGTVIKNGNMLYHK